MTLTPALTPASPYVNPEHVYSLAVSLAAHTPAYNDTKLSVYKSKLLKIRLNPVTSTNPHVPKSPQKPMAYIAPQIFSDLPLTGTRSPLVIRVTNSEDIPAIQALFSSLEVPASLKAPASTIDPTWLLCTTLSTDALCLIATFSDETVAGFCTLLEEPNNQPEKTLRLGLIVDSRYRRQGIGKHLLQTALDWVKSNPEINTITLEVMKDNLPARQLYELLGFQSIKTGRDESSPHTITMKLSPGS